MTKGMITYVVHRRVTRMDGVATRNSPPVQRLLVNYGVTALEVRRIFQQRVVLVLDVCLGDLLPYDLVPPVVVKPRLGSLLGRSAREQEGVVDSCDIEVDLTQT